MKNYTIIIIVAIAAVAVYFIAKKVNAAPPANNPLPEATRIVEKIITQNVNTAPKWTLTARSPLVYKETVEKVESLR
jgi:hypothetical protein